MSSMQLYHLENDFWQVGVLPGVGASLAYGRVRLGDEWVHVLRPTDAADYRNASATSAFLMMPWTNRIRDGRFTFRGASVQLNDIQADGTARHGVARGRHWQVAYATDAFIRLKFNSAQHEALDFPWRFQAEVIYQLDAHDFMVTIKLRNSDESAFPAGFGWHPYFVRGRELGDVELRLPCELNYDLESGLPTSAAPQALPEALDFRRGRPLGEASLDDVFSGRIDHAPALIRYSARRLRLDCYAEALFRHFVLFAPLDQAHFALEPVTMVNDGFNMHAAGDDNSGVFVLESGEQRHASAFLRLQLED